MSRVLTVANRPGKLALAQTRIVIDALSKAHPDIQINIKEVTTRGDQDKRTALWDIKDTGFFTSQVEDALLAGEADFAVHSLKDLPTDERDGLTIAAVCDRRFAEDCLVANGPIGSIEQLSHGAKIGTSSLRRAAQIRHIRPDLEPTPIRGNVETRIGKVDAAEVDAVILARAGIERIGLRQRMAFSFDPGYFIPAPAQGALAVQTRSDDDHTNELIIAIDEKPVRIATSAERRILITMQCGCHAPVGAIARIAGEQMELLAFISDLQGKNFIRRSAAAPVGRALELAEQLANELLAAGGRKILKELQRYKRNNE